MPEKRAKHPTYLLCAWQWLLSRPIPKEAEKPVKPRLELLQRTVPTKTISPAIPSLGVATQSAKIYSGCS